MGSHPFPSDEVLRTLLDIAPDSIAILRGETVLYMSPSAARLLGFERSSEVIGMSLAQWLSAGELEIATSRMWETIRTGRPRGVPSEYKVRNRDGKTFILEVSAVPITYGDAPAILAFVRDVTERRALERQVADSGRLAALGRLSAGVAHELNNPLTHLVLAVDGLRRSLAHTPAETAVAALAQTRDKLDLIAQDIDRMVVIARELRLFASPQPGARRPVDLRQPLEDALRVVGETHPAAALVQVDRHFDDVSPAGADPIRIGQVFVNLLGNAFDSLADSPGGCVTVELRAASSDHVVVHIRDQGPGIPEDLLERVFEPFFTTKAYGKGAGLGLAISRSIVQALGGSLDVVSSPGHGTTFSVTLPTWRPTEAVDVRPRLGGRRLRVLVVDDEAAIGRALASFLEGHNVVVTSSAREAEGRLAEDPNFDVILCDVVMPGRSGVEFHRELAEKSPGLARRVVFMTGATLGSDDGRALAALPNPVLEKPFDLGRLERVLDETSGP